MSFTFELPEIGEGVIEGEVVAWLVPVGEHVEVDQPLCEIMTDKATVEISSPAAGQVTKHYGDPGDIIKVHTPLAEIATNGAGAPVAVESVSQAPKAAPAPKPSAAPAPAAAAGPASDPTNRGSAKATPSVRRNAREQGVDVQSVPGTGKKGRVTHADVNAYATGAPAPAVMPLAPVALPQVRPSGDVQTVKIIGLRRKIAQQMVVAKQTAPHFTYVEEIDATRLVQIRKRLKPAAEARGIKLTFLPFIMKACSIAFRDFPNVNSTMNSDTFELSVHGDHNIGVAVDTPQGLFVPVVKNIEQKSILHIAAEMADLSARTRAGKASRDELTGGTFTVTSVGNIGGVLATPILNLPEVAILGVNMIRDRPMVVDGEIVIRKMMYLSPSFDHRIIDGAVGARFVRRLKQLIEDPESMLLELS